MTQILTEHHIPTKASNPAIASIIGAKLEISIKNGIRLPIKTTPPQNSDLKTPFVIYQNHQIVPLMRYTMRLVSLLVCIPDVAHI